MYDDDDDDDDDDNYSNDEYFVHRTVWKQVSELV